MISVVTPFFNGLDLLQDYDACTQGAQLVIIDNGSDAPTAEALRTLPPTRGIVIRNETNAGFAAANNQGYAKAEGEIIVFLNSDVAGDPVWLKFVADDVKDGYLYGPSVSQQLVYGMWLPYIEGWCVAATRATWARLTDALCNTAFTQALPPGVTDKELSLVRQELKDAFGDGRRMVIMPPNAKTEFIQLSTPGPWDAPNFQGPYWEDNDLCYRALQAGIGLVAVQWPIQHKGGRTAGALVKHGATFEANRATFVSRVKATWEEAQG
jgi:glycosyltransferase involved in cell wall biosynthesis